jgi:HAE1 family hydrophobic/amphiphilic exporter-1
MTTIAIVAGMLPIAFGRGAGSGSRASMAVTIIGGQMLCLLLTLLVTPVVYSYFDGMRAWRPSDLLALLRLKQPGGTLEPAPVVPVPARPADAARAAPPSPSAG